MENLDKPTNDMINEDEDFAAKWFAEWMQTPPIYGPATQKLVELIDHDPETVWTHILRLIRAAPNEFALNCVGAGPLDV